MYRRERQRLQKRSKTTFLRSDMKVDQGRSIFFINEGTKFLRGIWCRGEDLNLHELMLTST